MLKHIRNAGVVAGLVLIVFGAASIAMGIAGRDTVRSNIGAEKIVGSPDMNPKDTKAAVAEAGLKNVEIPSCSVAGKAIDTGSDARCFAQYMRIHTLEATGGQVYAEMGRFLDKNGKPTSDEKAAAIDPKTQAPVENKARNIWVNETALTTALNTSYFAENVALFSIVMGVAMLLIGIGLPILSIKALHPAAARKDAEAARVGEPALAGASAS